MPDPDTRTNAEPRTDAGRRTDAEPDADSETAAWALRVERHAYRESDAESDSDADAVTVAVSQPNSVAHADSNARSYRSAATRSTQDRTHPRALFDLERCEHDRLL